MGAAGDHGPDIAGASPELQFNYSLFHLVYYFEQRPSVRRFSLQYGNPGEPDATCVILEVTDLKACPEDAELGALPREKYCNIDSQRESLGAVPLLFVRFVYLDHGSQPSDELMRFLSSPIMCIRAASAAEVERRWQSGRTDW